MTRTADTNVSVSWTAPLTSPALGGYEVFYQTGNGGSSIRSSRSSDSASTTELMLTGLMLGQTYSIFVVAFGPEGASVLPSAHSNTEMITLSEFCAYHEFDIMLSIDNIQPRNVAVTPSTTSIMVAWTAPESVTPDSYSVSFGCLRVCDSEPTTAGVEAVPNGGAATSYVINDLEPGVTCTVRVIAMVGSASSQSNEVLTSTLTAGTYYSIVSFFTFTVYSSSYWCS